MINKSSASAAVALTGFIALAGCSMGNHGGEARNRAAPPAETTMAAQTPVAAETPEVSPRLLKRVQTALRSNGLYAGRIDGMWGPKTQGALRGYQQSHNLSDTGEIDSATLASLRIASASGTPAPQTVAPVATTSAAPTSN